MFSRQPVSQQITGEDYWEEEYPYSSRESRQAQHDTGDKRSRKCCTHDKGKECRHQDDKECFGK